jgi:hypothetical protein
MYIYITYMCIYIYMYIYVCVCMCICVCMYVCIHTHTLGSASDGPTRTHTAKKVIDLPVSLLPDMRVKRDLLLSKET